MRRRTFLSFAAAAALPSVSAASGGLDGLRRVDDEPRALLAILKRRELGKPVAQAQWDQLLRAEGYRRLQERDRFKDSEFKAFIEGKDLLGHHAEFSQALDRFRAVDVKDCGRRALAYLPKGSTLTASVYPVIKPHTNSFAYDLDKRPALFLYLHSDYSKTRFAATLAHELFHVGSAENTPPAAIKPQIAALPKPKKLLFNWMQGGFGEGFAVLTAAGGPDVDPASVAPANAAAEWAQSAQTFAPQMADLTGFFRDILSGKLTPQTSEDAGDKFLGVQGAWYTVGWRVAATIEKRFGRAVLVDCIADVRKLLPTYNRAAAGTALPTWPDDVAGAFDAA